jgi:aryl-alcohol dehydrogenase-like predicted oxidoreductase
VTTAPRPGVIVDGTWHKRETCNAHDGLTAAVPSIYRVKDETMQQTQLRTTQLGATGLEITRVGFGAWAIGGGGWEFGWGPQEDEESIAAIHRALELGVNWIDTAAAYGFGRSEQVVGRALEGVAQRPYVFTKASLVEGPGRQVVHNLKRDSILPDDDWRKHDPRFREPQLSRHLDLVERLTTVAGRHDTTPGAVAIAWTVRNPAVDGAIVGFRRADQVDPILTAASIDLTGDDVDEMEGR